MQQNLNHFFHIKENRLGIDGTALCCHSPYSSPPGWVVAIIGVVCFAPTSQKVKTVHVHINFCTNQNNHQQNMIASNPSFIPCLIIFGILMDIFRDFCFNIMQNLQVTFVLNLVCNVAVPAFLSVKVMIYTHDSNMWEININFTFI